MSPTKVIKTFQVESKALDPEQGIYEAMLSTEEVDRDGDILLASGADTAAYQRNPVVLFGHNYGDPEKVVAKALEIDLISGRGIKLVFQFLKRGISRTADLVHDLWAEGYLNAMSIGFIPKEYEPRQNGNLLFKAYEVLEGSIVTIPANASALRLALEMSELELGQMKSGRVLSAANESKIRKAVETLVEVLNQLNTQNDDEGKSTPVSDGSPDNSNIDANPSDGNNPDETEKNLLARAISGLVQTYKESIL